MNTRILPLEEWHKLVRTPLAAAVPHMPPDMTVIVVEEDGAIVGCWSLFHALHVEGLWIAPERRGTSTIAKHLLHDMRVVLNKRTAWASATSPDVATMLDRLHAQPVAGTHYLLSLEA
jgi:hypothetical protein